MVNKPLMWPAISWGGTLEGGTLASNNLATTVEARNPAPVDM